MWRNKLQQSFPYQYEVVDCFDGFDPRDPNIETFYDTYHVVRNLAGCLNDISDILLMIESLKRHGRFDPVTHWQDAHVLHGFAALVHAGRVVLKKPAPKRPRVARAQKEAPVQAPAPEPEQEPETYEPDDITIILKDEEGNVLPGYKYELELENGRILRGFTNQYGVIEKKNIPKGTCHFAFTKIDELAWRPESSA